MEIQLLKEIERNKWSYRQGMFKCYCGKIFKALLISIKSSRTKSCGCLRDQKISLANRTHGLSKTSEYKIWKDIRKRCLNPNSHAFHNYGGRGITICKKWDKFENFLKDMGKRPSTAYTVERVNNERGYSPSNCRWILRSEQGKNTRRTVKIKIRGEIKCVIDWCKFFNISPQSYYRRLKKGLSPVEALSRPSRSGKYK